MKQLWVGSPLYKWYVVVGNNKLPSWTEVHLAAAHIFMLISSSSWFFHIYFFYFFVFWEEILPYLCFGLAILTLRVTDVVDSREGFSIVNRQGARKTMIWVFIEVFRLLSSIFCDFALWLASNFVYGYSYNSSIYIHQALHTQLMWLPIYAMFFCSLKSCYHILLCPFMFDASADLYLWYVNIDGQFLRLIQLDTERTIGRED